MHNAAARPAPTPRGMSSGGCSPPALSPAHQARQWVQAAQVIGQRRQARLEGRVDPQGGRREGRLQARPLGRQGRHRRHGQQTGHRGAQLPVGGQAARSADAARFKARPTMARACSGCTFNSAKERTTEYHRHSAVFRAHAHRVQHAKLQPMRRPSAFTLPPAPRPCWPSWAAGRRLRGGTVRAAAAGAWPVVAAQAIAAAGIATLLRSDRWWR